MACRAEPMASADPVELELALVAAAARGAVRRDQVGAAEVWRSA
jgi:hypothetical protein